jgi:transcriptional antiterminator RfaH
MACISCGSLPKCFILQGFRDDLVLNMDDLSWLLVATKPRSEFVARQHLERQGFEVCLPQISLRKRKQGVWQRVIEPMFPGYVFLGVLLGEQDVASVKSTKGCHQLVSFGGRLVPMPKELILQFSDYERAPLEKTQSFVKGQVVSIRDGAFVGLQGVVGRSRGAERVELLLAFLGAVRSVEVRASDIALP